MTLLLNRIVETRAFPTLLEQKNNILQQMQALIQKAKSETRKLGLFRDSAV